MFQSKASRTVTGCLTVALLAAALPALVQDGRAEELESLSSLPGVQARRVEKIEDWRGRPDEVGFSLPLLEEFSLIRFSRWSLRSGRSWELREWEALDAPGAFGMFAEQRARWRSAQCGKTLDLPFDGVLCKRELAFWRGSHFMVLQPVGSEPAAEQEYRSLAVLFQDAITEPNLYPLSMVQLPLLDLHPETIRFFLGANGLGSDEAFPKGLIARVCFDKQAEVVSARYGPDNRPLFLFGYPTASVAQACAARINGSLPSYYLPEGALIKRSALLVALYLGPEEEGRQTLEQVHYDARVKWIYDRGMSDAERHRRRGEVISFFGIVTSSIFFTGFAAIFVIVLGVLAGLVRYQIIQRFPIVTERNETIRLDL